MRKDGEIDGWDFKDSNRSRSVEVASMSCRWHLEFSVFFFMSNVCLSIGRSRNSIAPNQSVAIQIEDLGHGPLLGVCSALFLFIAV